MNKFMNKWKRHALFMILPLICLLMMLTSFEASASQTTIAKGSVMTFGRYPQAADGSLAPVEWIVLDIFEDHSILAVSKYALKSASPSERYYSIALETTEEEAASYRYSLRPLDGDEVNFYSLSTCVPTEYAKKDGVEVNGDGFCAWWADYGSDDSWANTAYFYPVVVAEGYYTLWAPGSLGASSASRVGYRPAIVLSPIEDVTISFDAQNGSVSPSSKTVKEGKDFGTLPIPKRTGYKFDGWYMDKNYTMPVSADSAAYSSCTLYAKWTPITYTIAFRANGGSGKMSSMKCRYGEYYPIKKNIFKKDGYTFKNWKASNGKTYKNGQSVTNLLSNAGTITLYAQWTKKTETVTIKFDPMKGSVSPKSIKVNKGSAVDTLPVPVRKGYEFSGWYSDKRYVNAVASSRIMRKSCTLYAKWKVKKNSINYHTDGGVLPDSVPKKFSKNEEDIILPEPTKKGYRFIGWYSDSRFTSKITKIKKGTNRDVDVYAKWKPIQYTVSFRPGDGTGQMDQMECVYGKTYTLPLNKFKKSGAKFTGWMSAGGTCYKDGAEIKNLSSKSGTVILTAQWEDTNKIIENLKKDTTLKLGAKKAIIIQIAKDLLDREYDPRFIAGMLANIYKEGNVGKFESSNYQSNPAKKPEYLRIMDTKYGYQKKYSGKNITEVSLSALNDLLTKLSEDGWKNGKFGLGCCQWTGSRTKTLVSFYIKYSGGRDRITMEQAIKAESKMIVTELASGSYKSIYSSWMTSKKTAYSAGKLICTKYERPKANNQAEIRANLAEQFYKVMMKD